MKIVAVSDTHGILPDIPSCDLLLICGDVCPVKNHKIDFQAHWLDTNFRFWLKQVPAKKIVGICGNHDFIFQNAPEKVPSLPWTYLQDSGTEYEGLKIWGTPWQVVFFNWAFNLYEPELKEKWKLIPDGTDIFIAHGPPHGYGDQVPRVNALGYENVGSPSLLTRIQEVKPKLVVFGHIHNNKIFSNYGQWNLDGSILANVSLLDDNYEMVNKVAIFDL